MPPLGGLEFRRPAPKRNLADPNIVLDLRKTPKPRNYLARREQWRLLLLVLSLGLVAAMISRVRDPGTFAWFAALDDAWRGKNGANASSRQAEVDNRLQPRAEMPALREREEP